MAIDLTLEMGTEERHRAEQLSLERRRPPAPVPGYEPERFLGKGAYGEVWVALNRNTGVRAAIKFYNHKGALDWSILSREVEKLRFLSTDRHVVQLLEVGWDANPPYYIMEYLEHGSLEDRLQQGPLSVAEAVALFREVAVGLVHAHGKGILHCDLKPANILLDQDHKPRLADFGQSRLTKDHYNQAVEESGPALGTLYYMAPEQADLKAAPDARWDVYALGALLYRMLTGTPPHRTEKGTSEIQRSSKLEERLLRYRELIRRSPRPSVHRQRPEVDRALADIIDRCLARKPEKRFANVQAVLHALDARAMRRARRPLLVLGVVAPAILLAVIALVAWRGFEKAVQRSDEALSRRTLESNRFAAQFVAETVARKINQRWTILEREAAGDDFQRLLKDAQGKPLDSPELQNLQHYLEKMHQEKYKAITASSWFVVDQEGTFIARDPLGPAKPNLGKKIGYRDVYHGHYEPEYSQDEYQKDIADLGTSILGEGAFPPSTGPLAFLSTYLGGKSVQRWKPTEQAHQSVAFQSKLGNNPWETAFSVPVWSGKPGTENRHVIGILAMAVDVGDFSELQRDNQADQPDRAISSAQWAVLADTKAFRLQDGTEVPMIILEHPRLTELRARNEPLLYKHLPSQELDQHFTQGMLFDHYTDPFEPENTGQWLAAVEPVIVKKRITDKNGNSEQFVDENTGWVVIIQERHQDAIGPVKTLKVELGKLGAEAVALIVVVVTGVWAFVLLVLNDSSPSRVSTFLRRRAGLAGGSLSGSSGTSGSLGRSETSGAHSTRRTTTGGTLANPGPRSAPLTEEPAPERPGNTSD